jgi:hypothetical protein
MASETAQNTNWKNQSVSSVIVPSATLTSAKFELASQSLAVPPGRARPRRRVGSHRPGVIVLYRVLSSRPVAGSLGSLRPGTVFALAERVTLPVFPSLLLPEAATPRDILS